MVSQHCLQVYIAVPTVGALCVRGAEWLEAAPFATLFADALGVALNPEARVTEERDSCPQAEVLTIAHSVLWHTRIGAHQGCRLCMDGRKNSKGTNDIVSNKLNHADWEMPFIKAMWNGDFYDFNPC